MLATTTAGGFTTQLAGQATLNADFTTIAEEDARKGESIGIMVALVVLVVVFGAIVAALVPIGMAIVAIGIALGITALVGQIVEFNLFVSNIISMIGLAVGIDYSLFIVSRFREERKKGYEKLEAIGAAGATANRAVFFSGMTVVLALLGMFIIPTTIFRALGGRGHLRHGRLDRLVDDTAAGDPREARRSDQLAAPVQARALDTPHDVPGGFWDMISRTVMKQPWVFLDRQRADPRYLGSFYFQLNKGSSTNISQLPDVPAKAAFIMLEREFADGLTHPAEIVITGDVSSAEAQAGINKLRDEIAQNPAFSIGDAGRDRG